MGKSRKIAILDQNEEFKLSSLHRAQRNTKKIFSQKISITKMYEMWKYIFGI